MGGGLVATLTAGTWVEREFTAEVLCELDVRVALLPNQAIHAAAKAIETALARLRPGEVSIDTMPHADFIAMLGFQEAMDLQARYLPASTG